MYIDTHLHLSKKDYDDISKIIEDAKKENVMKFIVSGCDKDSILESLELIERFREIYITLGFHPSEANSITTEDIEWLKVLVKNNPKVVGIGEIGLDYHWEKENKELQKNLFRQCLDIAKELSLPVVIHSREATKDTLDILKEYQLTGVIHCFSGSLETAKEYKKLGYKIGVGGVVTFSNSNLGEVITNLSIHDIVLETDSPYLTPVPYRGKQNSPKYIPLIAKKIAECLDLPEEEVACITSKTAEELYDLN